MSFSTQWKYITADLVSLILAEFRSSRPEVFCEKVILKNFAKFTGKHLFQIFIFMKVAGLRPASLLEKSLWASFRASFYRTPPMDASENLHKNFDIFVLFSFNVFAIAVKVCNYRRFRG